MASLEETMMTTLLAALDPFLAWDAIHVPLAEVAETIDYVYYNEWA